MLPLDFYTACSIPWWRGSKSDYTFFWRGQFQRIVAGEGAAARSAMTADLSGSSKWYGACLGPDGKIYCVPFTAPDVLIIDPATGTAARSAMTADLSGSNKWYGACLGPDGKIYCVPYNATDVLIIDPATGTAARSAMGADLSGSTKWYGACLGPDGKIYCVPYTATDVLITTFAGMLYDLVVHGAYLNKF